MSQPDKLSDAEIMRITGWPRKPGPGDGPEWQDAWERITLGLGPNDPLPGRYYRKEGEPTQ